jgi:hypothetical protein
MHANCLPITPATTKNNSPIGFIYNPFNGFADVSQYWNNYNNVFMSQSQFQSYPFGSVHFFQ